MHTYRLIRGIFEHTRYQKILNEAYEREELIAKLSTIFGVQFRKDWMGRLYAVVNPAIKDGKFDTSQVFEYTQEGYDTTEHARQWMLERTIAMEGFIQTNNLFDALLFDIKKLDDSGNYLFILSPTTFPEVADNIKGAVWELVGLAVLAGGFLLAWSNYIA